MKVLLFFFLILSADYVESQVTTGKPPLEGELVTSPGIAANGMKIEKDLRLVQKEFIEIDDFLGKNSICGSTEKNPMSLEKLFLKLSAKKIQLLDGPHGQVHCEVLHPCLQNPILRKKLSSVLSSYWGAYGLKDYMSKKYGMKDSNSEMFYLILKTELATLDPAGIEGGTPE